MIVNLQSVQVVLTAAYLKDIEDFPEESIQDFRDLVGRYLARERLSPKDFKTFKIDKNTRILEFKVKDRFGNWRFIAVLWGRTHLVFLFAFHKKSQELKRREIEIIRKRVRGLKL